MSGNTIKIMIDMVMTEIELCEVPLTVEQHTKVRKAVDLAITNVAHDAMRKELNRSPLRDVVHAVFLLAVSFIAYRWWWG